MAVSVTMPRLGESVSEGTVTRWLKQEGERVEADEPLLEVSTDKVDTEIPSPAAGVLQSIKVGEDETVEVGSELAIIEDGSGGDGGGSAAEQPESEATADADDGSSADDSSADDSSADDSSADDSSADDSSVAVSASDDSPSEPTDSDGSADGEDDEPPQASADNQQAATTQAGPAEAEAAPGEAKPSSGDEADTEAQDAADSSGAESNGGGTYVTPLVRKLAAEHGVDLSSITGTGVGGRIRKQDVLDAAQGSGGKSEAAAEPRPAEESQPAAQSKPAGQQQAPPQRSEQRAAAPNREVGGRAAAATSVRGRTEPMSRLRQVIAERMVSSLQTSAQLTTVVEVDLSRIARLRERARADFEAREGVRLSFLPFFAQATCEALREHPSVNASVEGSDVTYHDTVHLGVAVDTERGLLVPVVRDASDLNLAGLARKISDLAERTRGNRITPDELGGGTFTLTNTGSRGALFDTPIINQPQVGILGTGAVVKRPVVVDDPAVGEVIAVRHMAFLALTYDHRLVDGADAARFLATIKSRLEAGDFEAELGL